MRGICEGDCSTQVQKSPPAGESSSGKQEPQNNQKKTGEEAEEWSRKPFLPSYERCERDMVAGKRAFKTGCANEEEEQSGSRRNRNVCMEIQN